MWTEDAIHHLLTLQRVLSLEATRDDERLDIAAVCPDSPAVLGTLDRMAVSAVGIAEVEDRGAGLSKGSRQPCGGDDVSVAVRHLGTRAVPLGWRSSG